MRRAGPVLLVLAVAAAALLVLAGGGPRGPRPPDGPAPESGDRPAAEPGPPGALDASGPLDTPIGRLRPGDLAAGPSAAGSAAAGDPTRAAHDDAMRRFGELLAEFGDVEAFLTARGGADWPLRLLPPEALRALLDLLRPDQPPEARFHAAATLAAVALTEDDLDLLEGIFRDEYAALAGPGNDLRTVLVLAFGLLKHGRRGAMDALADDARTGRRADLPALRGAVVMLAAAAADSGSAALLRELLAGDPDRGVRKNAAVGLGRIGGGENAAALAEALQREQDVEVRAWAALARGRAVPATGEMDPALRTALASDADGEVRAAAAFALSFAGAEGTAALLLDAYYAESHDLARVGAVAGIARNGSGGASGDFLASEGAPFLCETAVGGRREERYYAAAALSLLPLSTEASAALRAVAADDESGWVRERAVQTLVEKEGREALPFLRERLETEKSGRVRRRIEAAVKALSD